MRVVGFPIEVPTEGLKVEGPRGNRRRGRRTLTWRMAVSSPIAGHMRIEIILRDMEAHDARSGQRIREGREVCTEQVGDGPVHL